MRADLTVACDGRGSVVRQAAGLVAHELPVPFDVWWFRLPRDSGAQYSLFPRTAPGRVLIMIPREGYFQIAYLIPKGTDAQLRARGLDAFKAEINDLIPEANVDSLTSLDDVKYLDVRVNRLKRWHTDGLLCIGDAAHAMSPVGGVGINIAVQDAVGAATLLADPLRRRDVTERDLAAVRRRRLPAAVLTQAVQRFMHRRLVVPILRGESANPPAAMIALMQTAAVGVGDPGLLHGSGRAAGARPGLRAARASRLTHTRVRQPPSMISPPSTASSWPVMKCEPSLARNTSTGPRSRSASPSAPPSGMLALIC